MTIREAKAQLSRPIQTASAVALALLFAGLFTVKATAENQSDKAFADTPWSTVPLPNSLRPSADHATTQPSVAKDGTVDASQITGGFSAEAYNTAEIVIRWGAIKGAMQLTQLALFRSTSPKFKACYRNIVTDHAQDGNGDPQDKSPNHWPDNSVQRNTRYYYILAAIIGNNCYIAATGSCATPAHDQWDEWNKIVQQQAQPAQLNGQSGDASTPASAMTALIKATENDNADIVASRVALPPEPSQEARRLDAEQLIWASRLEWWMDKKFGKYFDIEDGGQDRRYAEQLCDDADLRYVRYPTKGELESLRDDWNSSDKNRTKIGQMEKDDNGWALTLDRVVVNGPLATNIQDQPNRIAVLRDVSQSCQAGKLKTVQAIRDALAQGFTAGQNGKADYGAWVHEDLQLTSAIHAIQSAIDRGDRPALMALILTQNDDDQAIKTYQANYLINNRAAVNAIVKQFRHAVALRVIRMFDLIQYSWGPGRDNTWVWWQDAAYCNHVFLRQYTPWNRMILVDGKWFMDCRHLQQNANYRFHGPERMAISQRLLANIKKCNTVIELNEALGGRTPESQVAIARAALPQCVADYSRMDFSYLPGGPEETNLNRALSIWSVWSEAGNFADIDTEAAFLYAKHDDGTYAKARVRWIQAANKFNVYVSWTMPTSRAFAQETNLLTASDGSSGIGPGQIFSVFGNSASADIDSLWTSQTSTIHMERVGGQWKIDISKLAGTDPKSAAKKLDAQTKKLEDITEQVKADKFDDVDQLKKVIKDAVLPISENPEHPAR
jgi:hypothetical protein